MILMYIGYKGEIIWALIFVILHEGVHYLTAKHYGFSGFDIEFVAVGACLKTKDLEEATQKEDLVISLSGPLFNLLLAIIFYMVYLKNPINIYYTLFKSNFAIGILNLIPTFPLDGGRVLRDLLSLKLMYKKAQIITINISICIGVVAMLLFVILFLLGKNSMNLGVIGVFVILSSLRERERISFIIMADIIKKRCKFLKKGYIENRSTSIYYKKDLLSILGLCDKNKYNIFTILDQEMKVIDIIYEEEVVEALKAYGNISIEKYLSMENGSEI